MPNPASARFIVDGLNLAYWCGQPPSLRLPLSLTAGLMESGAAVCIYFDASAAHRLCEEERSLYQQLRDRSGIVIEVPSGRRADGEILRRARSTGACVVSRDRFRDYRSRFRKLIDDPARLMPGLVRDEVIHIPALALAWPLSASAEEAWTRIRPCLPPAPAA